MELSYEFIIGKQAVHIFQLIAENERLQTELQAIKKDLVEKLEGLDDAEGETDPSKVEVGATNGNV